MKQHSRQLKEPHRAFPDLHLSLKVNRRPVQFHFYIGPINCHTDGRGLVVNHPLLRCEIGTLEGDVDDNASIIASVTVDAVLLPIHSTYLLQLFFNPASDVKSPIMLPSFQWTPACMIKPFGLVIPCNFRAFFRLGTLYEANSSVLKLGGAMPITVPSMNPIQLSNTSHLLCISSA